MQHRAGMGRANGLTIRGISGQMTVDGSEMAHQAIHRWLTEEAAAGRVESGSCGRWKRVGDRP